MALLSYLSNYVNVRKSYVFYGVFHHEWRNQLTHVIFVPIIFCTTLALISSVQLTPWLSLADFAACLYALTFCIMEPVAAMLYLPVIFMMHYTATHFFNQHLLLTLCLNLVGWIAQINAHHFFEKYKPAFMSDPLQAIHSAVLFVWLEVLFYLGFRPELKRELDALIEEQLSLHRTNKKSV